MSGVSILIPTHNRAAILAQTLESLSQLKLPPNASVEAHYWIIAGQDYDTVLRVDKQILTDLEKQPFDLQNKELVHLDREAVLGLRPEHIGLESDTAGGDSQAGFTAAVRVVESAGSEKIVHAGFGRHPIVVRLDPHTHLKPGETARFAARMEAAHVFDPDGQTLF